MQISSEFDYVTIAISTIAMFLQSYTFFVVLYKSPAAMKEYRYFLCIHTCFDFCFNFTVGYVITPNFMFPIPGLIIHGLGANFADVFGYDALRLSFICLIFCATAVVEAQDYCLFYRFAVISFNTKFQEFLVSKFGIFVFFLIGLFISLPLSAMFFFCTSSMETLPIFQEIHHDLIQLYAGDDWRYIIIDYMSSTTHRLLASIVGLFVVSEIISFCLLFHIFKVLSANADKFTKKTYKLQQQLMRVLTIQVINPIIFIILPLITGIFCFLTGTLITNLSAEIAMGLFTLYPCFNAVITVIFVTPYWEFTNHWLRMAIFCRKNKRAFVTDPVNIVSRDMISIL